MNTSLNPNQGKTLRILLVDDDEDSSLVLRAMIKNLPWLVDEAINGIECLHLFSKNRYDLVLMDIQMPEMDGPTAISKIRAQEFIHELKPTPIYALTSSNLTINFDSYSDMGFNGYIAKPITKAHLIQIIDSLKISATISDISNEISNLLPSYIERRKLELCQISEAFQDSDFRKIKRLGHRLCGTAKSYGFDVLNEIGKNLEAGAEEEDHDKLLKAIEGYQNFLRSFKVEST